MNARPFYPMPQADGGEKKGNKEDVGSAGGQGRGGGGGSGR